MTLAELKSNIDQKITNGILPVTGDLCGPGDLADFIQTLPSASINLSGTLTEYAGYLYPKIVSVTGALTDTWVLKYFDNTALSNVQLRLQFTQVSDTDAIAGSLSCVADVALPAGLTLHIKGELGFSKNLLFELAPPIPGVSALSSIVAFTGNDTLQSYIPSIDVFTKGSIEAFHMLYGFGPHGSASVTLAVDLGTDWSINEAIGIKNIGLSATVEYKPRSNGSIERSFNAAASGTIHIGEDFLTTLTLQDSTQWCLEVVPADGNLLPAMADLCGLAGGASLWQTVQQQLESLKISAIAVDGVKIGFDYAAGKVSYFALDSHVEIAGVQINTTTRLPDFQFAGRLAPGNKISLKAIIDYYFQLSDGFPAIDITVLSLFAWPGHGFYTLEISLDSNWPFSIANLKTITFQQVSASVQFAADGNAGSVSVTFGIAGVSLYLSAAYNPADKGWLFKGGSYSNDPIPIGSLFTELGDYFGIGLPEVLTGTTISKLDLSFNTGTQDFTFLCSGQLPFSFSTAAIESTVAITHADNLYTKKIAGNLTLSGNVFTFALSDNDTTTTLDIHYSGNISLADVAKLFTFNQFPIPSTLNDFQFVGMDASLDTALGNNTFSGSGAMQINDDIAVTLALKIEQTKDSTHFSGQFVLSPDSSDHSHDLTFTIDYINKGQSFDVKLSLDFEVDGVLVSLEADSDSSEADGIKTTNRTFKGGTSGLNLQVIDILTDLLPGAKEILPAAFVPDFVIDDVYITYDGKTGKINLLASTTAFGKAVAFFFYYCPKQESDPSSKSSYAFGIQTDVADLGGLPLVGDQLKDVKLTNVGFVYLSAEGEFAIPSLSKKDGDTVQSLVIGEAKKYSGGFNLIGELDLGSGKDAFSLTLPLSSSGDEARVVQPAESSQPPSLQPGVKWINVNKGVGPVKLNKIGFSYTEGMLAVLLDAELALAGITFDLEGLGLAFSPTQLVKGENIDPQFRLSGLGLSLVQGPLSISGVFVRVDPQPGEDISFYGSAEITTTNFSISGTGAYSQGKDMVSFFVYALYKGPIGGPACFFVTGIAAGFGYNRTVRIPDIQDVKDFPLVELALDTGTDKSFTEVLGDLISGNWIPASNGDFWLAAGIKFTTFKIIDSFVLVTVLFGDKLEFAILGLSLLKWPDGDNAIVYVEMAVLARFGEGSDVVSVQAALTTNSYVFDPDCKLTGGFAFYTWITGPHEGDFVITLGGYHPRYRVPDYYPKVDRLALNWKIGSIVTISGDMYYALTPDAIMAGGQWSVVCDLSFLKASVTIWADVLISWSPFYYQIDGGITVRIEADIDILFVTIHFSLSMGAEVHIWGPPFAGEIYVDWTIFSFTIPFGSSDKNKPPVLSWEAFKQQFLPQKDNGQQTPGPDKHNAEQLPDVDKDGKEKPLNVRVAAGIVDRKSDGKGGTKTIVNPYALVAAVDSFFPITNLYSDANYTQPLPAATTWMEVAGQDAPDYLDKGNVDFGIKPMGKAQVETALNACLMRLDETNNTYEVFPANVVLVASAKGMVSALWGNDDKSPAVLRGVPAGLQLQTTEAVDKEIISLDLTLFDPKTDSPTISYLANGNADRTRTPDMISAAISGSINGPQRTAITNDLIDAGFDLPAGVTIDFIGLDIDTPLYLAAIGQNIPDIIHTVL